MWGIGRDKHERKKNGISLHNCQYCTLHKKIKNILEAFAPYIYIFSDLFQL
jgi:hypothetical protein